MADEQPPAQPAEGASAPAENLHDDPVTGEKISKSELKRRQKQRDVEKKKAEKAAKAAALPDRPKKEKSAAAGEEELNPNVRLYIHGHS